MAASALRALAHMSDVAAQMEVRRRFPIIAEALLFAASGQLRNMATIGGNIMQRTRWPISRHDACPATNDSRSGCSALQGLNRNHAIFGWSDACVATNPSDLAVALAALDAVVVVRGPSGQRSISFTDFHRLPGNTPERDNVLGRGDLIVAVNCPHDRKVVCRITSRFVTASPTNSRWYRWQRRCRSRARVLNRRVSRWVASRTNRGASLRRKQRCGVPRWTTATR